MPLYSLLNLDQSSISRAKKRRLFVFAGAGKNFTLATISTGVPTICIEVWHEAKCTAQTLTIIFDGLITGQERVNEEIIRSMT